MKKYYKDHVTPLLSLTMVSSMHVHETKIHLHKKKKVNSSMHNFKWLGFFYQVFWINSKLLGSLVKTKIYWDDVHSLPRIS